MGGRLAKWFLKGSRGAALVSVMLRMVEKVMYVLWNWVRENLNMCVRENYVLEFLDLKSIFHEKQEKNKSYFERKNTEKKFAFAKIINDLILNVNLSLTYYLNDNECLKLMNGGSSL